MSGRAVAAIAALAVSACSYAFVRPPPADDPIAADDCTESRVPPVLDTALAGMLALTLLIVVPRCMNPGNNEDGTPADGCSAGAWAGLGWTAVVGTATAISAVHGFHATRQCGIRRALQPFASAQ
jgi:hypothetical protein